MFRQKCSWCNWTHDGNSKHTYTHPNYPSKVFYSKNCANSFISFYGEEPSDVPTADIPISTNALDDAIELPIFLTQDDLISYVVNKALDGDEDLLEAIAHKPTRGEAKAMLIKIKRGSLERPNMPSIPTESPIPVIKKRGESEEKPTEKPKHENPRGGFFSRLFNLNVRNIRINDKYDWKGKRIK